MTKKIVPVDYTSSDFEKIKKDLINYAKRYYPNTYKDFNEVSFGSMMMDLVSYVGDNLSFYLDYNANESFLNTSIEYDNVVNHARQLGYKYSSVRSSVGYVDVYMPVPAENSKVAPDLDYLPKLKRGSTFSTANGSTFTLIEDLEFYSPSVEVIGNELSSDGSQITYYILKATGKVQSGEDKQVTIEVGDYQRFLRLKIPGADISEIVSVIDNNGNQYYEVDYLSQNVVYRSFVNRSESTIDSSAPSVMKAFPVPRRFVTERDRESMYMIFGYGSETEMKNNLIADPSEVVLDMLGKNYVSKASFDPGKLLSTDKLGVVPVNTELLVTYRTHNQDNVNAAVGTVINIIDPIIEFRNPQNLDATKVSYILNNLESYNEKPINGDLTIPTTEEIRHRAYGYFATQGRAVTAQDYISAAYAMPANFGAVKRASMSRDDNDLTRNMNMYVISQDQNGYLQKSSNAIKENLKTWLNSMRMINDSLDILDTEIINIGIEFDIIAKQDANKHAAFDLSKEEIFSQLNEVSPEIGESFYLTEIFRILKEIPEVLDVVNVKVTCKSSSAHSSYDLSIDDNLSPDGRQLYIPQNAIWELKYRSDIMGTVR